MIITKTPLRVSFVGGGSDFPDYYGKKYGMVVSTAIKQYIYFVVNRRILDEIRVSYSTTEWVKRAKDIKHNLIREAMRLTGIDRSIDIVYIGDVPMARMGTGLGSSSAIAVGALQALHAYKGEHVSAERLAREACQVEIDVLKHPMGKQDQYIASYGGLNEIRFHPDESVVVNPIVLDRGVKEALERRLLLFSTGLGSLSAEVLPEQKAKIKDNLSVLDKMVELAERAAEVLRRGNIDDLGGLLHENWLHKKRLATKITNGRIDRYYKRALEAGASGGKILGSGGGGFLLLYCDEKKQSRVRKALGSLLETRLEFEPQGSRIIYVSE